MSETMEFEVYNCRECEVTKLCQDCTNTIYLNDDTELQVSPVCKHQGLTNYLNMKMAGDKFTVILTFSRNETIEEILKLFGFESV